MKRPRQVAGHLDRLVQLGAGSSQVTVPDWLRQDGLLSTVFVGDVVAGFMASSSSASTRLGRRKCLDVEPAQSDRVTRQQPFSYIDLFGIYWISDGNSYLAHHGQRRSLRERPAVSCCIVAMDQHRFNSRGVTESPGRHVAGDSGNQGGIPEPKM